MSLLDGLSEPEQRQLKRLLRKLDRRAPPSSSRQSSDTRFRALGLNWSVHHP